LILLFATIGRKKMEWIKKFWGSHGERLVFLTLANALAVVLFYFKLVTAEEVKVVFIGSMMLLYNKARGTNGGTNEKT